MCFGKQACKLRQAEPNGKAITFNERKSKPLPVAKSVSNSKPHWNSNCQDSFVGGLDENEIKHIDEQLEGG